MEQNGQGGAETSTNTGGVGSTNSKAVSKVMEGISDYDDPGNWDNATTESYNDGEISTCGWIIEVHSVQSTMMGRSQHVGGL